MITTVAAMGVLGTAGAAAAGVTEGFDPLTLVGTTVTPVAVVLLLVFGWLRTKGEAERLEAALAKAQDDAAKARNEHAALVTKLVDDVVPALTRSADATAASTAAVEAFTRRAISGGG